MDTDTKGREDQPTAFKSPGIGVRTTAHLNLTRTMAEDLPFFERRPDKRADGMPKMPRPRTFHHAQRMGAFW